MRARPFAVLATSLALATALVGCGSGEEATSTIEEATTTVAPSDQPDLSKAEFTDLTGQAAVGVQARDNTFVAPYIEVDAGTVVTFTNRGRNQHNVVSTVDGAFTTIESTDFEPGTDAELTFDEPGLYPYYCSLHGTKTKGMVGAVRVLGA